MYAQQALRLKIKGVFIAKATDDELSEMLKEMCVSLAHKVELREAVAAWRADPQQVAACCVSRVVLTQRAGAASCGDGQEGAPLLMELYSQAETCC
jgi:HEPN domain-containing protein